LTGFNGVNGNTQGTLAWGGFTAVNNMTDGSNIYILGASSFPGDWRISTLNPSNLGVENTATFSLAIAPGFGFIIDGNLFLGDYQSGVITERVDTKTGNVSTISRTISGLPYEYISNASYDPLNDTVYLYNTTNQTVYSVANASSFLGVSATPEPSTYALMLGGLGLVGFLTRRRTSSTSRQ
jgi:hypothetical protein